MSRSTAPLAPLAAVLLAGCAVGRGGPTAAVEPEVRALSDSPGEYRQPPADLPPYRVDLLRVVPEEIALIPRWGEPQFGAPMPATTFAPSDQAGPPIRWDRGDPLSGGAAGRDLTYVSYHGHGCCGACQTVALLGAVLAVDRIERRAPVPRATALPHRPAIPGLEDELELAAILAVSRHAYIGGGRDVPYVAPALAVVGAPTRADARPLLPRGRSTWLPSRICRAFAGKGLPVVRARVREHDVRFMTLALRQGPVVISGAFNRLRRDEDGIYRCPEDAEDLGRHHFMLVIGWETNDSDHDGDPDEVVWLVRDDWERGDGGEHDTWGDGFLDDEWGRIVPRGCLLDGGRAHSIIPGSVRHGSFDDPVLPGRGGRVSFCESDPDGDGVPVIRDTCPYYADPDQADADGDDLGDLCDPCPEEPPVDETWPGHIDSDQDWIADACDPCPEDDDEGCLTPAPEAEETEPAQGSDAPRGPAAPARETPPRARPR